MQCIAISWTRIPKFDDINHQANHTYLMLHTWAILYTHIYSQTHTHHKIHQHQSNPTCFSNIYLVDDLVIFDAPKLHYSVVLLINSIANDEHLYPWNQWSLLLDKNRWISEHSLLRRIEFC